MQNAPKRQGQLIVISGPAGVGKGTVINLLLDRHPNYLVAPSYTTRPPRKTEDTKKKYFFTDEQTFMKKAKAGEMLEWKKVHAWHYGLAKRPIEEALAQGKAIVAEVDVQGGADIKKMRPDALLIFITYPKGDLAEYIRRRITTDPKREGVIEMEIETRIETAQREMAYAKQYDYQIENPEGHPEQATEEIEKILGQ